MHDGIAMLPALKKKFIEFSKSIFQNKTKYYFIYLLSIFFIIHNGRNTPLEFLTS